MKKKEEKTFKIVFSMKENIIILLFLLPHISVCYGQGIIDDGILNSYVNAYGQMTQRAIEIMHAVQPYRERQYELYKKGYYDESIKVCVEVINKYVKYVFENKGISDMECLAGDAAVKIKEYEVALTFYQMALSSEDRQADYKLSTLFSTLMMEAHNNLNSGYFNLMQNNLSIASKTGYESGEYYYYWGKYYEHFSNYKVAQNYYRKAKRKGYASYAEAALKQLKDKKNK